jgi:hypothetical protein
LGGNGWRLGEAVVVVLLIGFLGEGAYCRFGDRSLRWRRAHL